MLEEKKTLKSTQTKTILHCLHLVYLFKNGTWTTHWPIVSCAQNPQLEWIEKIIILWKGCSIALLRIWILWKIVTFQNFPLKNEKCNLSYWKMNAVSGCLFYSDITDTSDLITVHDLGGFPKLAHVLLINDLGFHYILKIFTVMEWSPGSVIRLPVWWFRHFMNLKQDYFGFVKQKYYCERENGSNVFVTYNNRIPPALIGLRYYYCCSFLNICSRNDIQRVTNGFSTVIRNTSAFTVRSCFMLFGQIFSNS